MQSDSDIGMPDPGRLVVLLGGVRSGTTVLRRMLGSHPRIVDGGEIFNPERPRNFYSYLQAQAARQPELMLPEYQQDLLVSYLKWLVPENPDTIVVIDVKYEQLRLIADAWSLPLDHPPLLGHLRRWNLRVIHLRRDPFQSVLSNLVAMQTQAYHLAVDDPLRTPGTPSVRVDRDNLRKLLQHRHRTTVLIDGFFEPARCLAMDYGDMFDRQGWFRAKLTQRLSAFLGVDAGFDRVPALRKVIDRPLAEVISNYDEIRDLALETRIRSAILAAARIRRAVLR